jgi:UDP-2,3-diacylglucosamine pyrophosphatase LpxH
MGTMRTLILSDIHLGSKHCNVQLLNEVLDHEPFDRLILNGDTLHNVNLRKLTAQHWALLERFRTIGKSRELVLIRGNHDHELDFLPGMQPGHLTTGRVLPALLEVPMLEQYELRIGGEPYAVLHGDRFDPTMNYPMVTEVAFFCYQFTTKVSKKLAKWLKRKSKRWGGILEMVRAQSIAFATQRGVPGVITGHTHFAEDLRAHGVHYMNSGSWTESPCSYLTSDGREIVLRHMAE